MRRVNVAILAVLLAVLTAIFAFQAQLSRSRRAHRLVRNGFLLVVLVWLGWTAGAQLSIVNVINYIQAPFRGFGIGRLPGRAADGDDRRLHRWSRS